jgi:hypothetical protein
VVVRGDGVGATFASGAGVVGLVDEVVAAAASTVADGADRSVDGGTLAADDGSARTLPDRLGAPWDTSAIAVEAKRRAPMAARRTGVRVMGQAYDRLGDRSTGR